VAHENKKMGLHVVTHYAHNTLTHGIIIRLSRLVSH